jgi:hypothetical protein
MKKILFLIAVIFALTISAQAQVGDVKQKPFKKFVLTIKRAPKILTGGWSLIDDNGTPYQAILAPKSYTANIIPMTFNYDLYYGQGVFFNIKGTFCNFKKNKTVNGEKLDNANLFFSLDFNTSISLNSVYNINYKLLKLNKNILDFRLIGGFGYTNRNIYVFDHAANFNFGGGMYSRFSKEWGMNIELISKFGLKSPLGVTNANYIHSSIGVSYFIGSVKFKEQSDEKLPKVN